MMEKCPFWTAKHLRNAESAESFFQLGDVLLEILSEIRQRHPRVVVGLVSGPITTGGYGERANRLIFRRAIELLRSEGFCVLDQTPIDPHVARIHQQWKITAKEGDYCWRILEDIYYRVISSGDIGRFWSLKKYETSIGAVNERKRAGMTRGIEILSYPEYLYRRILNELEPELA